MPELTARHYQTGEWVRLAVEGATLRAVGPAEGPAEVAPDDEWVAPAFWDVQLNGRWGVSFSDPGLDPEQVGEIVRAQAAFGVARLCPTLITAGLAALRQGVSAIAAACDADRDVAERVVGIHLEGPYISSVDGYRGAHPLDAVRDPDWDDFQRLQEAAGGRVVLMTLAPERRGALAFIRKAVASGVTIALGHTAADGETLRAAAEAGATLSTHLGNGIASPIARHPNPIWEQAANDALFASIIADGEHLDPATLRVLVRAKTPGRVILVSDASPLAGLSPGTYGAWAVDDARRIVVAGTQYLAGSSMGLDFGLNTLLAATGLGLGEVLATVTAHPARLLGRPAPTLGPGEPADLVRFRHHSADRTIRLLETCVRGSWTPANDLPSPRVIRPLRPSDRAAMV